MTRQRYGKMRHVWKSNRLHPRLKMRLYVAGVCSVMVYGLETCVDTEVRGEDISKWSEQPNGGNNNGKHDSNRGISDNEDL